MVGGQSEFVLCASGHVQTLVCPTDNPKAKYFAVKGKSATKRRPDPDSWMADAAEHNGSWWTHWFKWLNERSEGLVNAPKRLDSNDFPSLGPAPGTYVHAEA
jgi:polyhydroxyalkanoate synthase